MVRRQRRTQTPACLQTWRGNMTARDAKRNFFRARHSGRRRIGAAIATGVAMLAIVAIIPTLAHASSPTLSLSPTSAVNFAGGTHTVTATLTGAKGHCADPGFCGSSDVCTVDTDCQTGQLCDGGFARHSHRVGAILIVQSLGRPALALTTQTKPLTIRTAALLMQIAIAATSALSAATTSGCRCSREV